MNFILFILFSILILTVSNIYAQQDEINQTKQNNKKLEIVASFYPLYEIAKEIGGNNTLVTTVIPFGVEPHNWEIAPQQIPQISKADMIIFNGIGFDSWLGKEEQFRNLLLVDISKDLQLDNIDAQRLGDLKQESTYDPHIWLDPILVKNISQTISNAFIKLDPNNAVSYKQNTKKFFHQLDELDSAIKKSLSDCELKDFIAFHQAFQYFANRYGLTQHTIHESISPESEILPQQITKIIKLAKDLNIDTIYSEDLVDPKLSEVLASEIPNGKVLLLSPVEGINREELANNVGYIDKMYMNLENLKQGLKCE
jgi:zinc transport system substrate-binding protein